MLLINMYILKGQRHEDFDPSNWAPNELAKKCSRNFPLLRVYSIAKFKIHEFM